MSTSDPVGSCPQCGLGPFRESELRENARAGLGMCPCCAQKRDSAPEFVLPRIEAKLDRVLELLEEDSEPIPGSAEWWDAVHEEERRQDMDTEE